LLGAYQALMRQVDAGNVTLFNRREMLDVVTIDGKARGITVRNLLTGEIESYAADAVLLCTGGYGNVYYLSTNAINSNVTAAWRAHKKGAAFANPCYTQIHPTCIPVSGTHQSKLTLMSESLRNDGRVWVPKQPGDKRPAAQIPEEERDYFLERRYPAFGNLVPRDVASRAAKLECDNGKGVGGSGLAVYLDFADAINRLGESTIRGRYGNLFQMYEKITDDNPYQQPMRIYPAVHYTMGGLWVDYNLMTSVPGLYALGECNFSDHGANRLGASALMQGLADGYFVIPYTIGDYLAGTQLNKVTTEAPEFKDSVNNVSTRMSRLLSINGSRTAIEFHRELGQIMWDKVGMGRTREGLTEAISQIQTLRGEFWQDLKVTGEVSYLNQGLERAARVADFMEFGELLARDALNREESCGGHFREEYQTPEGEALRDDENFFHVAAWEWTGDNKEPILNKDPLVYEKVKPSQRSYK
jgi:succinate dehydrogenase / fumarate reductase flavoprotein subunit